MLTNEAKFILSLDERRVTLVLGPESTRLASEEGFCAYCSQTSTMTVTVREHVCLDLVVSWCAHVSVVEIRIPVGHLGSRHGVGWCVSSRIAAGVTETVPHIQARLSVGFQETPLHRGYTNGSTT